MSSRLVLASTSRAQDAGLLALADVASVAADLAVEYRVVGGHMVSLLVAHYAVVGVPERETADADFGASFQVSRTRDCRPYWWRAGSSRWPVTGSSGRWTS